MRNPGRGARVDQDGGRGGWTLREAVREFCDPDQIREMDTLADETAGRRIAFRSEFIEGPSVRAGNRRSRDLRAKKSRSRAIGRSLTLNLVKQLRDGQLVAIGYVAPVVVDARTLEIPKDKWRILKPNFRTSSAAGGGLEVVDIRVYLPKPIKPRPATKSTDVRSCRAWFAKQAKAGTSWKKRKLSLR